MEISTLVDLQGAGFSRRIMRAWLVIPVACALSGSWGLAATFAEQRAAITDSVEIQPESVILKLLKFGITGGQPTEAVAETRRWLRQNIPGDPMFLYHAGRASELSGDAPGAAALYQQYLKQADPMSESAGRAVISAHSLLKDQLNDPGAAYSFNRATLDRLAGNGYARQFDHWFLEEAMKRKDGIAVVDRLLALKKARIPDELWVVYYEKYLRWLLDEANVYVEQPGAIRSTPGLVRRCKDLAAGVLNSNKELALRLDWAVSVRAYNLAKLAEEDAVPPITEAKALLEAFPEYAVWVQTGWAGGGNGQHYRGDPAKYWPHEIDSKMEPVMAAAAKLKSLPLADLLSSWAPGFYNDRIVRPAGTESVRRFLTSQPSLMNSREGVLLLEKAWNDFTPEEAAEIAPRISANSDPEVSLIGAIAAGGPEKDFEKMVNRLMGAEVWRLGPSQLGGSYVDQLWHYAGRPGGNVNRDQKIKESSEVAKALAKNKLLATDELSKRLDLFRILWKDYGSGAPTTPNLIGQIKGLLEVTPEAIAELLKDGRVEARMFARNAIAAGITGHDPVWKELEAANKVSFSEYGPGIFYLAQRYAGGSIPELEKRHPQKCHPHPLEPTLRESLFAGLAKKKIDPWQVMAWINMQYPGGREEVLKLINDLSKSGLWKTMPFEIRFAAREWFPEIIMSPAELALKKASDPTFVAGALLALTVEEEGKKKKNREATADHEKAARDVIKATAALKDTLEKLRVSPVRIKVPGLALNNIGSLDSAVFADEGVIELILQLVDEQKMNAVVEAFGNQLIQVSAKGAGPTFCHRAASYIWIHVNQYSRIFPTVKALTQSQLENSPSAASSLAEAGLRAFARHRGHSYFDQEVDIPLFKSIRGKAAMTMGLVVIPVAKGDPAYPVFQSQADWITGNEESAWDLLDEHWEAFLPVHRELSMAFLKWGLQRVIFNRDENRQEELIKALMAWAAESGNPLSPAEKIEIEIAYGDIAMQRGQLRQAHEIYGRTAANEAYQDYAIRHRATLRRARADRIAKNFDGALQTLDELDLERIPEFTVEIKYARALAYFDMEEFDDAADEIDEILTSDPDHPDARILLGKVQLKRQKLMEATEVELGSASRQKSLFPGEKLKVTLSDPTLAVSGAGTEIEVVVWASSGDRETFFLRQFGDQKTKFRGDLPTALGKPSPGDRVLQVIGDDEIFYAYSERFRTRMNNLPEQRGGPVTVASDAVVTASARKLLTEAEQRLADMEALMAELEKKQVRNASQIARARLAADSLGSEARSTKGGSEFQSRIATIIKPGNAINVRVTDPDRSRTGEVDQLVVSVASSSGDTISRVVLQETGTHTGRFEGRIPTTGAQAMAFAEDSEPGRNPNMVISPREDYPAWRPTAAIGKSPVFTIDLNDNVEIGKMEIAAMEPDARLKNFVVQTAMNSGDWTTVARYPDYLMAVDEPWKPSVVVMNDTDHHHNRNERSVHDLQELKDHLDRGWMVQEYAQGVATNVPGPAGAFAKDIPAPVKWKRQGRSDVSHVIYRFRAYFHEPREVKRRFRVDLGGFQIPGNTHPSVNHPPQFLLAVDGRAITKEGGPLDGHVTLRPGLHYLEIWATGWVNNIGFGRSCKVLANLGEGDRLVDCPDRFFDPGSFPSGLLGHRNAPAEIGVDESGGRFAVSFAPESRARLVRLIFLEQEGPVPAVNRISLVDSGGAKVLPVGEDFASLGKNDTLEILTGDKISVRYIDDRFVTEGKEKQERFLDVAFTDARVEFADMEPRWSSRHGKEVPFYEKLLRFSYDEPLSLAISDPDMDVSVEADSVKVTVRSDKGFSRELLAVETGPSTGIFKASVTPVAGEVSGDFQIQVSEGGYLVGTYLDSENNSPGVPVEREGRVIHAGFQKPELLIADAKAAFVERDDKVEGLHDYWQVESVLVPGSEMAEGGVSLIHGQMAHLELHAPQLALRESSAVILYAQTEAGRRAAGKAPGDAFDIRVPGTLALTGELPSRWLGNEWRDLRDWQSGIYRGGLVEWGGLNADPADRFRFSVPLVAGVLPLRGVVSDEERDELRQQIKTSRSASRILEQLGGGLVVKAGEPVYFGVQYQDRDGEKKWLTSSARVATHPAFEILDEDFREEVTSAYAGESLHLRVSDLGADLTDEIDAVFVLLQAKSGARGRVELRETGPHSGVFTGAYLLSYAEATKSLPEDYDIRRLGLPVIYGDAVAARYTDSEGVKTPVMMVSISKGADGTIQPFSKQYEDPGIAMRTQFSLAEAYLEIAKRHRRQGEKELAAREYEQAKQLLANAMEGFRDPETRAHAEYLLGNLTLEEADTTEEGELKQDRYRAALARFMTVTGSYPETLHASKAQFRTATIYEKLKEPEIAAQEYVKLAYKYPDSEYLATSMARLGSHFLKKAATYESESKSLLEKEDDKDAVFKGEALQKMASREYLKTAQIFSRMQERFPDHEMAGTAGLRAGQAYMRAGELSEAIAAFMRVINEESYDGKEVRSQAMYWSGKCYQDQREEMAAYSIYKRLTYDFPESEWAAYARGELSQGALLQLEGKLELERLEEGP